MTDLEFKNAWVLYLLWLVPVMGVWWLALLGEKRKALSRLLSDRMQQRLCPPLHATRTTWQIAVLCAGLALMLVAAARPGWGRKDIPLPSRGRDLVILLDVSRSMLAADVRPNRLSRAKADIRDLIDELKGDRVAILAFRQRTVLLCPLTSDYHFARLALDAADTDSAPPGKTHIGDAIRTALGVFPDRGSHKAVILVSDGEDLSGEAVDAAEDARANGTPVFTVGIGSRRGARIPHPSRVGDYLVSGGEEVVTRLDSATLAAIARTSAGGRYVRVGTSGTGRLTLGALYRDHLSALSKKDYEEERSRGRVERYTWFLLPGWLLALTGLLLSRGRLAHSAEGRHDMCSTTSATRTTTLALVGWIACGMVTGAQEDAPRMPPASTPAAYDSHATTTRSSGRHRARAAQRLYRAGRFDTAAAAYLDAAHDADAPAEKRLFGRNAGIARFKAGKYADAADILRPLAAAVPDPTVLGPLAMALYETALTIDAHSIEEAVEKTRLFREATESLQQLCRTQPEDEPARRALFVSLRALQDAECLAAHATLLARYSAMQASDIVTEMLKTQRDIVSAIPSAYGHPSPHKIEAVEALALRQTRNAELWIPLTTKLQGNQPSPRATPPQIDAGARRLPDAAATAMREAAERLRNIDPTAREPAAEAEDFTYKVWKQLQVDPAMLIHEDLRRQTNALQSTADGEDRAAIQSELKEAAILTDLFTRRLRDTDEHAKENPSSSPGVARILELAELTGQKQEEAVRLLERDERAAALVEEEDARDALLDIQALLAQAASSRHDPDNDRPDTSRTNAPPAPPHGPRSPRNPAAPAADAERQLEEGAGNAHEKPLSEEDVLKLLEQALRQEREHEAQKRRRAHAAPGAPIEGDW